MIEKFDPGDKKEYKEVKDLPRFERSKFRNVKGGGFVTEEAFLHDRNTPRGKQISEAETEDTDRIIEKEEEKRILEVFFANLPLSMRESFGDITAQEFLNKLSHAEIKFNFHNDIIREWKEKFTHINKLPSVRQAAEAGFNKLLESIKADKQRERKEPVFPGMNKYLNPDGTISEKMLSDLRMLPINETDPAIRNKRMRQIWDEHHISVNAIEARNASLLRYLFDLPEDLLYELHLHVPEEKRNLPTLSELRDTTDTPKIRNLYESGGLQALEEAGLEDYQIIRTMWNVVPSDEDYYNKTYKPSRGKQEVTMTPGTDRYNMLREKIIPELHKAGWRKKRIQTVISHPSLRPRDQETVNLLLNKVEEEFSK